MNSGCFTCALLEADPEIGEPLTVLTLRRVHFPHTPVILTASEVRELRALLNRWDETNATPDRRVAEEEEGAEP
jgi:hypothetical protein